MAPFRLQKLLDLKTWRERERAAAVEGARAAVVRADVALDRLVALRVEHLTRLQQEFGSGRSAGELLNLRGLLEQIDQLVARADIERDRAREALDATLDAFAVAATDRRSFEKLKERHVDTSRRAASAAERASLDEVGLRCHAVRHAGGGL